MASSWPELWGAVYQAWETHRNEYNGLDSLLTLLDALGIGLAFLLKIFNQ